MKNSDKTARVAFIIQEAVEYLISLFVTGTMLGYILDMLGFSDAQQGIISTVATFTCGAQLFALLIVGRKRKRIVTVGRLINQICFVLMYLLPIFNISPMLRTLLLMLFLFVGHIINNALTPTKLTWLMGAVPNEKRGVFTAVKEMISLAAGIALSLSFGMVADVYRDAAGMPTRPYYVIGAAALIILTVINAVSLLISAEKDESIAMRVSVMKTVGRLIHNPEIVKVISVGILWDVASALSASFFTSYLRQELSFTFTAIALMSTVGSVCRIVVSPLIGRIADKYSFATSMTISFVIMALAFFVMSFAAPQTRWLYLVYVCLHAFSMAGLNSGLMNLIYDYVAPFDRAVALGVKNAAGGICAFFTALFSGFVLGKIQAAGGLRVFGMTLYAQQVLSLMSCVGVVALIVYMRAVIAPLRRISEE